MLKFIFIRPQLSQNIGAVARILKNFGFEGGCLHLVEPKFEVTHPDAISLAAGADDLLFSAHIHTSWEEAVADSHILFATTACPREMVKEVVLPSQAAIEIKAYQEQDQAVGIIFGPERTGLTNDEIGLCQKVITIPVNPEFSSLNLAQACAILAYELSQTLKELTPIIEKNKPATQKDRLHFLNRLEQELDQVNYWRQPSKKPIMKRNLWNIFTRMELTEQELRSLRGMLESLLRKTGAN